MFIHRLTKFLSRVALVAAALAFCVTYYDYPEIVYEGRIFISSVGVAMAIIAGLLSLALGSLLLIRRLPPKPWNAIVVASLSIVLALTYVALM